VKSGRRRARTREEAATEAASEGAREHFIPFRKSELLDLELVLREHDEFRALSVAAARQSLDARWDGYFEFAPAAAD
jgi:hypothetical protein